MHPTREIDLNSSNLKGFSFLSIKVVKEKLYPIGMWLECWKKLNNQNHVRL